MIAAGLGCRNGCSLSDVLGAIDAALVRVGRSRSELRALFTLEEKDGEPALQDAARQLDKPLVLLPRASLEAQAHAVLTPSPHALARFGLASVSEAAALAGAFELARRSRQESAPRLLAGREVFGGATCALAAAGRAP